MVRIINRIGRGVIIFSRSTAIVFDHIIADLLGRDPKPKVFAIGFNKMGTSSLHDIFNRVGYNSYHGEAWRSTNAGWVHKCFNAFCDGVPEDFRLLDQKFPKSKFILQVRDLDSWMSSRIEHISRRPADKGNVISADWTIDDSSVQSWVVQRNEHHLNILKYFSDRPDDLLVTNFIREPNAAADICEFLGSEIKVSKPHFNQNKKAGQKLKHAEQIHRCLRNLNVDDSEFSSDLLCTSLLDESDKKYFTSDTALNLD